MDKLARIKSIDNFRFFDKYNWDNSLKPFEKYNIVYGWNGCGKSTLSDFFHGIENNDKLPLDCTFKLCFQEEGKQEKIFTQKDVQAISKRFKVYHQHYSQGLITNPSNIKHITIIGHDEGKNVARVEELEKEKNSKEVNLNKLIKNGELITGEFIEYRKERASLVRSITSYKQSYNFKKIYDQYKLIKNPTHLTSDEYKRLSLSVHATQKGKIDTPKFTGITEAICKDVLDVLMESPVFSTIERLENNPELRKWVQGGYDIHKENDKKVCEFCRNPIKPERWSELESCFNDSYNDFKKHINSVIQQLETTKSQYVSYQNSLPHSTQLFDELLEEYKALFERSEAFCESHISFINKAIDIVKTKSEIIIGNRYADDYKTLLSTIDFDFSIINEVSVLLKKHNGKADAFSKSIAADEERLENHIIAQSSSKFTNFERKLAENEKNQKKAEAEIDEIKKEIRALDDIVKNSRIPAETINRDISFIFGHSDLHFEWQEKGYQIKRNGMIAEHLSTGEQNAIALIYFFNTLQDSEVSKESCVVILDDPISSFDSNYYYSAAAYIREKLQSVRQAFIFTHKFALYKDFSRMFSGKDCHKYLLERENNKPAIKAEDIFLRDYQDEYVYLFYKINSFVKQPPCNLCDYLPYPNMGRRLLEGFLSFKMPTGESDMLAKAIKLESGNNPARIRAITRLVQNQSHLRLIGTRDKVENILDIKQLPEIFRNLLDFIKDHDRLHFDSLMKQVAPDSLIENEVSNSLIE